MHIHEVHAVDACPIMDCALVDGPNLAQWLERQQAPPPLADAMAWMVALGNAVHHAHQRGVLHRDIKPANVLLEPQDGALGPMLTDFGLARFIDGHHTGPKTESGIIAGTPAYMAPERIVGPTDDVGVASEVYSLGVVLYGLLTLRTPLSGNGSFESFSKAIAKAPPPRPAKSISGPSHKQRSATHSTDSPANDVAVLLLQATQDHRSLNRRFKGG